MYFNLSETFVFKGNPINPALIKKYAPLPDSWLHVSPKVDRVYSIKQGIVLEGAKKDHLYTLSIKPSPIFDLKKLNEINTFLRIMSDSKINELGGP